MTKEKTFNDAYKVSNNCLYYCGTGKNGYSEQKLCNFVPKILSEVLVDDGTEITSRVRVSGVHESGKVLPEVELPTREALELNWVTEKWGVDCILELGTSVRERIRYALQLSAKDAERRTEYAVTGWKEIDGKLEYLLPGDDEHTVHLEGKLGGYAMDRRILFTDLEQMAYLFRQPVVKEEVLLPLLAFTFLCPLNHFLKQAGHEPKFILLLQGKTGSRKSTLAALMLSFYGRFTASDLPMSFRDTANSIIANAHILKDVLTCIDDFHPTGRQEEMRLTATAQAIMRAYGDRTGRGRLNADCTTRISQPPQGNAILTAESFPDIGESGTARYFALEIKESNVDLDSLSTFQRVAEDGVFQRCMWRYISWLQENFLVDRKMQTEYCKILKNSFLNCRNDFRQQDISCHGRVPEMVAWMRIGMEYLLSFLLDEGCFSQDEKEVYTNRFVKILTNLASEQAQKVAEDKPTHIFIRKLYALIESGQAVVLPRNGSLDSPSGTVIGYEDERYFYLFGEETHKVIRQFCEAAGESFPVTLKSLLKQLAEEELISKTPGAKQNTKVIHVNHKSIRVLCLIKIKAEEVRLTDAC